MLVAYQERKREELQHVFLEEKMADRFVSACAGATAGAAFARGSGRVSARFCGSERAAMLVLVTYDVKTSEPGGQKRLRQVAKACRDFGQRVQFSGVRAGCGYGALDGD